MAIKSVELETADPRSSTISKLADALYNSVVEFIDAVDGNGPGEIAEAAAEEEKKNDESR